MGYHQISTSGSAIKSGFDCVRPKPWWRRIPRGAATVPKPMYYFYIVRCKDRTLYCGSTNDTAKRIQMHNSGRGSKYVRSRGGGKIVYIENFRKLAHAMHREFQVKKWTRIQKLNLIKSPKQ